jgi:hypothetical protein
MSVDDATPSYTSQLRLPRGLSRIVDIYANAKSGSRNETLARFLERGYVVHKKAENAVLEAMRSLGPDGSA